MSLKDKRLKMQFVRNPNVKREIVSRKMEMQAIRNPKEWWEIGDKLVVWWEMEMQVVRNPNVNPMARPMRLAASPEAPRRQVELEEGKEGTSVGLAPHRRPRQSPTNLLSNLSKSWLALDLRPKGTKRQNSVLKTNLTKENKKILVN